MAVVLLSLTVMLVSACSRLPASLGGKKPATAAGGGFVSGSVNKLDKSALPQDAEVWVSLTDVTQAPPQQIGKKQIPLNGKQLPAQWRIKYDPAKTDAKSTFAVSARVIDSTGKVLYASTQSYNVITNGSPVNKIVILVEPAK
jgi:putative lipoprotein